GGSSVVVGVGDESDLVAGAITQQSCGRRGGSAEGGPVAAPVGGELPGAVGVGDAGNGDAFDGGGINVSNAQSGDEGGQVCAGVGGVVLVDGREGRGRNTQDRGIVHWIDRDGGGADGTAE